MGWVFLGNLIEVKYSSCLLYLFSVCSICKVLDTLQRCLLLSHQIVTSFQTGILDLFLLEQLCEDTPPSLRDQKGQCWSLCLLTHRANFISQGICTFLSQWSGHLANLFSIGKLKMHLSYFVSQHKCGFPCWFIFYCPNGLWSHKLKMISMLYSLWVALRATTFQSFALFLVKHLSG